ncbi:MAG: hypothetical protein JXA35_01570 [Deltaproteobacteria bacterium]|nr:hypothetical protein [Deltaproteobacteria bacterium]
MKPYYQGALDSICAIYSIVNATRMIAGINDNEARLLFRRILAYLEKTRDLSMVLTEGIGLKTIGGILKDVVRDKIRHRNIPFKHHPDTALDEFWTAMAEFLEGGDHRAILIGLGGPAWDHWTIIESISDRQIRFFDSHKLKQLNRNRCTTNRSTSSRPHMLCPTHTYFLS